MNFKTFPKIELHVHLDGSIDLNTASSLTGIPIERLKKELQITDHCQSLKEYLTKFKLPLEIMQTKENIEQIATALAKNLKEDGVIYAEIRFAPNLHTKQGLTKKQVVDAVLKGLKKVNIKTNLLLCCMRNDTIESNKKIIDLAQIYHIAIDLAGDEANYQTEKFSQLFIYAKEKNVPFTIHAGEADGPSSIASALKFGAKRIGHGIHIIENQELMKQAIKNKILLEVCPTSNIQTASAPSYETHPIKQLHENHLQICINTDNRTVSNITLTEEYQKLHTVFHFTKQDFINMNYNAIEASFLTEKEKNELKEKYQKLI